MCMCVHASSPPYETAVYYIYNTFIFVIYTSFIYALPFYRTNERTQRINTNKQKKTRPFAIIIWRASVCVSVCECFASRQRHNRADSPFQLLENLRKKAFQNFRKMCCHEKLIMAAMQECNEYTFI